jgi:hypothetical protein
MLSVVMLSVVMLSVVMLRVIILIYDNDLRLIINIHLYEIFTTPLLI